MSDQRGRGARGRGGRGGRGSRGGGRGRGSERGQGPQQEVAQALTAMNIQDRPTTTSSSTSSNSTSSPDEFRSLTPESLSPPLTLSEGSPGASFLPEEVTPAPPVADVRIGSSVSSSALVSGTNLYPPARPRSGHGTLGRRIALKINFFGIKIPDNTILNQYRVEIFDERRRNPEENVIQKHVCRSVWSAFLKQNSKELAPKFPVYDGQAALYTKQRLWGSNPGAFQTQVTWEDAEDGNRKRTHLLKIVHTGEVELSLLQRFIDRDRPYETADTRQREFDLGRSAIQAIEIILSQLPKSRYTTIGRSHYLDPGYKARNLGQGCDIWEGYYQSLRPGQWKPYINIDISFTAIMQDSNLLDFICDVTNTRHPLDALKGRNACEVINHLCGLKVTTKHMGYERTYKLCNEKKKVLGTKASEHKFELSDGTKTNSEKYFKEKYKIRIEFPNLPQVLVGRGNTLLPMELCTVVRGQHKKGKLTADQTSEMIKQAAMPADERMWKIEKVSKENLVATPLLDHYGIKINPNMLGVEGRVLDPPKITYENKDLVPRDGSWDLRGVRFKTAMTLDNWVIIDFVGVRNDALYNFLDELRGVGKNSGIMINDPRDVVCPKIHQNEDEFRKIGLIEDEFNKLFQKYNPMMFIIFLNEKKPFPLPNKEMYKHVKRICDYELGVLSQCVKDKNILKANKSTVANICLKMNAKLGGVNHVIDTSNTTFAHLFKKPIMFIGADVNHPHPGMDEVMPSIAAAVGSIDSKLAKYVSSVRFQKHSRTVEKKDQPKGAPKKKERLEMIDHFEDMCEELISAFKTNCKGRLPERIIYYRDGVSEGQFRKVLDKELNALRAACRRFSDEYQPAVTIVCVQKRHHLRMFPKNERDGVGRGKNVPPGCVVDTDVSHPVEFDFYLCSHFGLQGTSKPAHYHVLWDENNFDSNQLQALTYHLCHLYARCTKAVSIPAPVYYAHWVAFRAMMSTSFEDDSYSVRSGSSEGSDHIDWDEKRKKLKIKTGLMYWA